MVRPSIALFVLLATAVGEAAAQRSGSPSIVTVSARVGGKTYGASGPGTCRHSPSASIYDVPAALWMVEVKGSGDRPMRVHLTLWRPKDSSPEQVSLALETGSSSHRINVGGKAEPAGSGMVKLSPSGTGGRFDLKGKDSKGTSIDLTITCPAFAGVEAEGG